MKRKLYEGEITSLHRTKKEIEASKAKKEGVTASTWYLKGDIYRTVKCQPSPNGSLAIELSKALNPMNNTEPVQPFGSLFRREVLNKDLLLKKVLIRSLFGPKGPYFQLSNPNNALYLLFFNLPREVIS